MPSTSDQDVLIRILTAYEKGGMEAAIASAKELQKTVDENSEAGKTLSGALDLLNSKGQSAGQVFNGVSGILKGGQGAAAGFANVVKGLGGALGMAAGPLALLTTGVGLAITAWQKYKSAQEEAAEAAKKAAEEAQKAAEEAAKALEERIGKAAEEAKNKIKGVADGFKDAAAEAKAMNDAANALGDAQLEAELANIDAAMVQGEGESDEDFARREADLKKQKVDLQTANDNAKLEQKIASLEEQMANLDKVDQAAKDAAGEAHAKVLGFDELDKARQNQSNAAAAVEAAKAALPSGQTWSAELEEAEAWANSANADAQKMEKKYGDQEKLARAEDEAATAVWEETVARNNEQRQIIQAQIDAARIQQSTNTTKAATKTGQIERDYEKSKPKAQEESENPTEPAKPTVGELWRSAAGQIENAQNYKGTKYEGDAAGDTQQKARAALAEAGRTMAEGKKGYDAAVMRELVESLEEMGAVVKDRNQMLQDLQEAVSQMRSQIKNLR